MKQKKNNNLNKMEFATIVLNSMLLFFSIVIVHSRILRISVSKKAKI